ncbi:ACT domain-containing protein [Maledivibacter halophilus]|uniref:Acetolactate synthase, small subunit n=1 Tax=Maledivibacter halophilus TaxID=36842 RepID=A0A1T5JI29_9FIRM|nr:ACT domain-containing protein [Maledivibacter halophilus]SKC50838.1 acetolactate synthase, small subunit [Maledivibacter halophilus]
MEKKLLCRVDSGLETLIRVVGLLKRKRFNVKGVNMEEISNSSFSNLEIVLKDELNFGIEQAINQMEKLVNVYDVREVN